MATGKKWVRFTVIVDHSTVWDLMEVVEGKALHGSLDMQRVKHGGEDAKTGKLRELPTGRAFAMAYAQKNPKFQISEAGRAAEELGLKKASVYTSINTLMGEGVLKRIAPGTYQLTTKSKAALEAASADKRIPRAKPGSGESTGARIISVLQQLQNGSGEGVPLKAIKKSLGNKSSGVSPAITDLLKKKVIVRTSPSHYRVAG